MIEIDMFNDYLIFLDILTRFVWIYKVSSRGLTASERRLDKIVNHWFDVNFIPREGVFIKMYDRDEFKPIFKYFKKYNISVLRYKKSDNELKNIKVMPYINNFIMRLNRVIKNGGDVDVWLNYYNTQKKHSGINNMTPYEAFLKIRT
jgi:hypothetical protein